MKPVQSPQGGIPVVSGEVMTQYLLLLLHEYAEAIRELQAEVEILKGP